MVSWLLIILILIGVYIFIKSTGFQYSRTWAWVIGGLVIFFLVTYGYIITRPGIDVNTLGGLTESFKIYFSWLGSLFDKAGGITGQVTNTDWRANFTSPNK